MPVIQEPQYYPSSAYDPLVYQVFTTAGAGFEVPYTKFTVYVNGVAIATDLKEYYTTAPSFGLTEYYFEVNVQEYLQRWLANGGLKYSMFGDIDGATQTQNPDGTAQVHVVFTYKLRNTSTRAMSDSPLVDTSGETRVIIGIKQNGDTIDFDDFMDNIFNIRFLTNRPSGVDVCEDSNAFLSFLEDYNYFQVSVYNSAGVNIDSTFAPTNAATDMTCTIGVGRPQLAAITNWINATPPDFTGGAYYIISLGIGIPIFGGIIFTGKPQTYRYNLIPGNCCGRKLNLFWLNSLGGVDHYSFAYEELEGKSTATEFQKALSWSAGVEPPRNQYDHGRALTNIKVERVYKVKAIVAASEMIWLREMFWSAQMFIQNPDGTSNYWRAFIQPGTYIEKKNKGGIDIEFILNVSQDIKTHRV